MGEAQFQALNHLLNVQNNSVEKVESEQIGDWSDFDGFYPTLTGFVNSLNAIFGA